MILVLILTVVWAAFVVFGCVVMAGRAEERINQ